MEGNKKKKKFYLDMVKVFDCQPIKKPWSWVEIQNIFSRKCVLGGHHVMVFITFQN